MTTESLAEPPWDLSPVYALIQSLSQKQLTHESADDAAHPALPQPSQGENGGVSLGDFNNVWAFLGVPLVEPARSVPTFEAATAKQKKQDDKDAYASDGAVNYGRSSKTVKWRDETDGGDLEDTQADDTSPGEGDHGGLTKNQRKKRNRKLRKAAEQKQTASDSINKKLQHEPPGSGDESDTPANAVKIRSSQPASNEFASESYPPSTPTKTSVPKFNHATLRNITFRPMQVAPPKTMPLKENTPIDQGYLSEQINAARDKVAASLRKVPQTPEKPTVQSQPQSLQVKPLQQRPVANRMASEPPGTAPPAVKHVKPVKNDVPTPYMSYAELLNKKLENATPKSHSKALNPRDIQPLVYQTTADRNWALLLKLLHRFPESKDSLLSPLQLSYNHPVPYGIHVFVDASNILIGFMDHLKRARNIPDHARVPRVYPSFHALALLLERRRPVAKRVLAGSTPHVAAFDEAKQIGYDCSILDKVWKARELTERQRRFAAKVANGGNAHPAQGSDSGGGLSDSVPHHQQPKWVEQGVDEVLHLKILESILDTPVESHDASKAGACERPTMVLATGDAAEAEYSSGFRRMVERALQHGWNCEVMAWGASINHDWRKMAEKAANKGRFRLIELDDFCEELFSDAGLSAE